VDTEILHEIHHGLEAARSAGLHYTQRAFEMLPELNNPRILDVGCGPGAVTLELARLSGGQVFGLDIDRAALQLLFRGIKAEGLAGQVQVVCGSMFEIGFRDGSFDVVWAEGSLHFMGLEKALGAWRRLIKPGGFLVVHEMAWLQPEPPQAIVDRWKPVFTEISTLQKRIRALRERAAGDRAIQQILEKEQREVDLFQAHARWYGSAFLVMQRSSDEQATAW
jgi:SAM-dependent methyltransferase